MRHANARKGQTPEAIAEWMCKMNVYEGMEKKDRKVARQLTLVKQNQASFATVFCFTKTCDKSEREHILTVALRGFLESVSPDFAVLLRQAGIEGFDAFYKRLVRRKVCRHSVVGFAQIQNILHQLIETTYPIVLVCPNR